MLKEESVTKSAVGSPKGGDEICGQLGDEPYCVRQQHLLPLVAHAYSAEGRGAGGGIRGRIGLRIFM